MKLSYLLLAAVLLPLATAPVSGETVLIDEAAQRAAAIEMPARGMSMQAVRERFGSPQQELPAVGEPPITRWVYDRFTVYFEHHLVITSVVKR